MRSEVEGGATVERPVLDHRGGQRASGTDEGARRARSAPGGRDDGARRAPAPPPPTGRRHPGARSRPRAGRRSPPPARRRWQVSPRRVRQTGSTPVAAPGTRARRRRSPSSTSAVARSIRIVMIPLVRPDSAASGKGAATAMTSGASLTVEDAVASIIRAGITHSGAPGRGAGAMPGGPGSRRAPAQPTGGRRRRRRWRLLESQRRATRGWARRSRPTTHGR